MARPAARDGLRVRGDLLAAVPGMGKRRCLATAAPAAVGPARPAGPPGLVPALPGRGGGAGEKGGELVGPNPVDRGKPGSKYHLLVDANGIPLAALLSAANTHDSKLFQPLLDGAPAIKGPGPGRPRRRPDKLHADKGYDHSRCRAYLRRRGITARIARRGVESKRNSAGTAGSSNAPSPGSSATSDSACATTGPSTP